MEYSNNGKEMRTLLEQMEFEKILHPFDIDFMNPVSRFLYQSDYKKKIITEGLIHTYPADVTVRYISGALKINKNNFAILQGENKIEKICVTFDDGLVPKKLVVAAFNYCGYFCSFDYGDTPGMSSMVFEQRNQGDDTDEIRGKETFLYHISPRIYEDNILTNGLSPRHRNLYFNYPERVYLINGSTPETKILSLGLQLADALHEKLLRQNIPDKYKDCYSWTIYKIDIDKLPSDIRLFKDPDYKFGIFTPDNVPTPAFSGIGHFDYHKFNTTGNVDEVKIIWNIR